MESSTGPTWGRCWRTGRRSLLTVDIRLATEPDLPGIFFIYDREVREGVATFDTEVKTAAERQQWFADHRLPRHPLIVALEADEIVGWGSLSPWSARCAYIRTAENSVYVRAGCQGRGIGKALLADLLERGRAAGLGVIAARIVEGNPASIRLHEAFGFETVGVMRRVGEKFGRILDVRIMQRRMDGPAN